MTYRYDDSRLPRIIIIGAGFAGLELVKRLNNKPFSVLLLDKNNFHTFQPLLYQIASGGLTAESIAYPLRRKIGRYPNIAFRMAEVTAVDPATKTVSTDIGNFSYDHLIIASGATTNYFGKADLHKNTFALKTVQDALQMRNAILQQFEQAVRVAHEKTEHPMHFVIVGGGPTGVELAGALAEIRRNVLPSDYRELDPGRMEIHLIEGADRVLGTMSQRSSRLALRYLEKMGVSVWLKSMVEGYDGKILKLNGERQIPADHVIWTAGVRGAVLPGVSQDPMAKGGRYFVDGFNRLPDADNIFAVGDIACMQDDPKYPLGHPGVAQVAMQQAKNLAKNLMRSQKGKPMLPFRYKNLGNMATIGRHRAVVDLPFLSFGGYLAWYIWMFVHLMALVGFRNRFTVFLQWMWNYLTYDRAMRLIIKGFPGNIKS